MTITTVTRKRLLTLVHSGIAVLLAMPLAGQTLATQNASTNAVTQDASAASELARPEMLARKLANPLSDIISVPFQFNWVQGVGPDTEMRQVTNIQPVVPVSLSERWNVIARAVMPFISQPDTLGSASGAGDAVVSAFISPKAAVSGVTWGVGPVVSLPLTTNPMLGSGEWSAGPTGIVMKQQGHVMIGVLANQLWSFADRSAARAEVSQMLLQPVVSYVTGNGVTFTVMSEMTANWKASTTSDRWTVPVTAMVSRIQRIGVLPVSMQAGGGYYLASPEGGPSWQVRTTFIVILPKKR